MGQQAGGLMMSRPEEVRRGAGDDGLRAGEDFRGGLAGEGEVGECTALGKL